MRAPLLVFILLGSACGSSSSQPDASHQPQDDGGGQPGDDAPAGGGGGGFKIDIGQAYESQAAVTINAITDNGIYAGYFQASSDLGTAPSLTVSIVADGGELSTGTYACADSETDDVGDETSVLIHWLDGDTYYTNVQSPACTVTVTAASQTSVSATISGSIYDETQGASSTTSFTASFVAAVHDNQ